MALVILLGLLAAAVFGCVCVVWAERGGPRWVRVMAALTRGAGGAVRALGGSRRSRGGDDADDD
ncbi:hypothetical protein [Streptomyces sp. NPDC057386]|uniref:hypothetical protein n=1 Tax=unclassified Streptomyces TaxID=2593676 RepID=UPI003638F891